jgi:UDP-3-O-acyl N-acetylglucosamine deacetylase
MTYRRKTVRDPVVFEGLGLHSGVPVKVSVRASEKGIVFRHGNQSWQATPENVTDTRRCTKLGDISTVEHLMSALSALEITDADIEVSEPELPAMDGSSAPFYQGLLEAGIVDIAEAEAPELFSRIFVPDGEAKIAISAGSGHWRYEFHTGERWPGLQVFETENVIEDYGAKIAPARTFGFEEELPMIAAAGLAKGLDESSALVLGQQGYLNEARSLDEPVLHKMLDAIGDLYLAGIPIRFLNVTASRTGHTANVKAAELLFRAVNGS